MEVTFYSSNAHILYSQRKLSVTMENQHFMYTLVQPVFDITEYQVLENPLSCLGTNEANHAILGLISHAIFCMRECTKHALSHEEDNFPLVISERKKKKYNDEAVNNSTSSTSSERIRSSLVSGLHSLNTSTDEQSPLTQDWNVMFEK